MMIMMVKGDGLVLLMQGVKMLWKFKQLLNPAQVFDLISGGPKTGSAHASCCVVRAPPLSFRTAAFP